MDIATQKRWAVGLHKRGVKKLEISKVINAAPCDVNDWIIAEQRKTYRKTTAAPTGYRQWTQAEVKYAAQAWLDGVTIEEIAGTLRQPYAHTRAKIKAELKLESFVRPPHCSGALIGLPEMRREGPDQVAANVKRKIERGAPKALVAKRTGLSVKQIDRILSGEDIYSVLGVKRPVFVYRRSDATTRPPETQTQTSEPQRQSHLASDRDAV